jgi:hypothetical protein
MSRTVLAFSALTVAAATVSVQAYAQQPNPLNHYVLLAVADLAKNRSRGGYDLHRRFTRNLNYGGDCCLKSTPPVAADKPNPTMCVAAIVEVMVEALNLYRAATGDDSFRARLPLARWNNGTRTGVIPNVFMYAGSDSAGTAFALQRLGLGTERRFEQLQPGDFINFNRTNASGHAVVFMGYLVGGSAAPQQSFSPAVVGFRYFSAQGMKRADGGFGYRNAYFVNKCPKPRGRDDDCNILGFSIGADGKPSQSRRLLNTGTMYAPSSWTTEAALAKLRETTTRSFENEGLTRGSGLDAAIEGYLGETLDPDETKFADGTDSGDGK